MKQVLIVIFLSFFFVRSTAQSFEANQQFAFKQPGLTFIVPTGFSLIDSSTHTLSPNPEIVIWRQQFVFQSSDGGLTLSISTSTQRGIDWDNIYQKEAKHYYDQMRIRNPEVKFDSSSTIAIIDSQQFNKFIVLSKENSSISNTHVQLSKFFKGYKINIAYNYKKPELEVEFENFLKQIKFVD